MKKITGAALCAATLAWFASGFAESQDKPAQKMPNAAQVLSQAQNAVSPNSLKALLRTLTEEPHVAGTPADYRTATFVRDKLNSWGWKAELEEFEVLLNYPVVRRKGDAEPPTPSLEILRPEPLELAVDEKTNAADKDSASPDSWPAFHGYGVSGTASGQIVYANYGRPEDFETLGRLGVEVRGRIVLARYGKLFRGLKVREAQKRGALGILIFSDPADDGYARGDVYPNGPYRPGSAIQRGSVQFLSFGPGDPSTPGVPSLPGTQRLPFHARFGFPLDPAEVADWEARTGLKRIDAFAAIPALPISYDAARQILDRLAGPNVPADWQGGLPLAYHAGPGPVEVRFSTEQEYRIRKIWNVVARLEGREEPNQEIMIGNHRDAWTYGAVDPSSGTAATMEMCRVLGAAYAEGWRPRRTLVYSSWDGEEYGLVGSTEHAEAHAAKLGKSAALMLNVDSAVSGTSLDLEGIPSLRTLILDAAATVTDPRTSVSLKETWLNGERAAWNSRPVFPDPDFWKDKGPDAAKNALNEAGGEKPFAPKLGDLGSGSDYTAFVDHLGIPAMDINFGGRYGVYHSTYDNFFWMEKFGDPEFIQHATAAKLYTAIVHEAASRPVLPLRFVPYAEAIEGYVDEIRTMSILKNRAVASGKDRFAIEGIELLADAVKDFRTEATETDKAIDAIASLEQAPDEKLKAVNDALAQVERAFLHPGGLPGRPWYKHVIYAPGLTTGYAAWPLPGLRQAVIGSDKSMAKEQTAILVERLRAAIGALRKVREAAMVVRGG
ncbi:M28 family peptidase [bacterium]|nr:M28 family peptidase [bacterium]